MVARKKTPTQRYIDTAVTQAVKAAKANSNGTHISNCSITVEKSSESVIALCEAVKANAEAIKAAAESMAQQNVYGIYIDGGSGHE